MKKKFFFAVATIVAAVSVGYAAYLNQRVEMNDTLLENIEALGNEEVVDACPNCSTDFLGDYCCTVLVGNGSVILYHLESKEDDKEK